MPETQPEFHEGLEGVLAGKTALSDIDGRAGRLVYRGYAIEDLAENVSYEEAVHLLLYGELPTQKQLKQFCDELLASRPIPKQLMDCVLRGIPAYAHPMDVLQTGVALLGVHDKETGDVSHDANLNKAKRIVAKIPAIIADHYRLQKGMKIVSPDASLNHAANFLYALTGEKPDALAARVFDRTLVLYAEHGFNASTFAARVTASTLSDMHAAVASAVGTLRGPLHGKANENAMRMLLEIGSAEKAEAYIEAKLAKKERIMGFGHRVYKTKDPRAQTLKKLGRRLSEQRGHGELWDLCEKIEALMLEKKNLNANVDFYSAPIYFALGIPIELYTSIFALARSAGWCAHVMEQQDANKLIRPLAAYVGQGPRRVVPLAQRR